MIPRTEGEVLAKLNELYAKDIDPLDDVSIKAVSSDGVWELSISRMYEYMPLGFDKLTEISKFFDTMNIQDSRYSTSGCETCNYGSNYEITITVKP